MTKHSHSSIHWRGKSKFSPNHQPIPSSDHTGNCRVAYEEEEAELHNHSEVNESLRNSTHSPIVNDTPKLEPERLQTSCGDPARGSNT